MTQLERYIDPPSRSPFSWTTMPAPSSRARAAAARPPIPAPATTRSGRSLDEREGRLVLDVLELDPVRTPDEDGEGVRGVADLGDLDPAALRLLELLLPRVAEKRDVVEERPLALRDVGARERDGLVAHRQSRLAVRR